MAHHEDTTEARSGDESAREDEESPIREFFQHYARALAAGDGPAMAALWEVPALVLSDDGARAVRASEEVAAFFGAAKEQYNAQGVTDTRAEIGEVRWVTSRVALVDVRWPYLDDRGQEMGEESATYTLRRDDEGQLRVRAVIMHGAVTTH